MDQQSRAMLKHIINVAAVCPCP